ncbi:hypothetical protein PRK78_000214 [Emydomyces testavorans]|uniref:Nucleotidyltransferase family protein n=1 Tax=Emydomyces testavorans TaxID=2070801 RepID=A0AAF0DA98_9EURO|nr:hypothetical protein PRK78_000214 [Emydomyces testavorans]
MYQARLNDASIALFRVLHSAGIKHGIFGGYAIAVLGGPRESKDVDCIASVSKAQIISILNNKEGFQYIDQSRDDYVAFLWSDRPDRAQAVLVEIFVEAFEGNTHNMQTVLRQVSGQVFASGHASFLDPAYIFKGKLRAAATRSKFHDSADLWLADE